MNLEIRHARREKTTHHKQTNEQTNEHTKSIIRRQTLRIIVSKLPRFMLRISSKYVSAKEKMVGTYDLGAR